MQPEASRRAFSLPEAALSTASTQNPKLPERRGLTHLKLLWGITLHLLISRVGLYRKFRGYSLHRHRIVVIIASYSASPVEFGKAHRITQLLLTSLILSCLTCDLFTLLLTRITSVPLLTAFFAAACALGVSEVSASILVVEAVEFSVEGAGAGASPTHAADAPAGDIHAALDSKFVALAKYFLAHHKCAPSQHTSSAPSNGFGPDNASAFASLVASLPVSDRDTIAWLRDGRHLSIPIPLDNSLLRPPQVS